MLPDYSFETRAMSRGAGSVAGVDEVGRGPLAGPVTAAAVILDGRQIPEGLNDSKKLTLKTRERLEIALQGSARIGIGHASVEEIDAMNILRASHVAMCRAIAALEIAPDHVLIDGNMIPRDLSVSAEAIVKGDTRSVSIAAASIVAKLCRDRIMVDLAQQHPGYGWERNMGYGTAAHMEGLKRHGPTPFHRRSFKPIHDML